jgi:hypothetical protein
MNIDLKNPNALTLASVRDLIGSKDDSQHRQLRVTSDGIAFLSDDVAADKLDNILFRFETWIAGNGYCGAAAAADDDWVREVYEDLRSNWPEPKSSYIDF